MKKIKLPKRGTSIGDLRCEKCKKKQKECLPKNCTDPDCPYKK